MSIALERIERSLRQMNCCISPKHTFLYIPIDFRGGVCVCVCANASLDGSPIHRRQMCETVNTVGVNAAALKITIALVRSERNETREK